MTDLTEKWKKGKLEGEYYIETNDGKRYTCELQTKSGIKGKRLPLAKCFNGYVQKTTVTKVLAPVPSYEEWWKLQNLLGKCYRFLRLTETKVEAIEKVKRGLVKEIDEVLK